MLKSGMFVDSKGQQYTVFIMETNNYSRTDICMPGAQYHVDYDKVVFSIIKRRKIMMYGDVSLHTEMQKLIDDVRFAKLKEHPKISAWEDGKFKQTITRGEDNNFFQETKVVNGKVESEIYAKDGMILNIFVVSFDMSMVMDPINRDDYKEIELESSLSHSASSPYVPASVLKTRFNLDWDYRVDYRVITDLEEARSLLTTMDDGVPKDIEHGVDTETNSLEFHLYSTGHLVGFILSPKPGVSWYFPFRHKKFANLPLDFLHEIADAINKSDRESVAHNKKFERKVFMKSGVEINIEHDSYQASVLNNPVLVRGAHSLKNVVAEVSGEKYLEFDDIFLDKNNIDFSDLDMETVRIYACPDSDNARVVLKHKLKELPLYTHELYKIECALADLKADQEYWGFRVNTKKFLEGYNTCEYIIKMLEKLIHALTKSDLKLTSNDHLADLLYNKMKCPIYLRTKTGRPSTGAKAIKKLAKQARPEPLRTITQDIVDDKGRMIIKADALNNSQYPVVVLLEKYREFVKLKTAFYNRIQKGSVGSRYFFWINQNGAESGRQSSPMHQLPKEIKADILSDSSEHVIYGSDYSQIELRLTFSLAGETSLINLCFDPDNDIHRAVDSGISGTEVWAISSDSRQKGKSRNFGVVYLIAGQGLAVQRHGASPTKEQIKQAEDDLAIFFNTYKRIAKFIKTNREKVEKQGQMRTLLGRTRYFDKIFDPDLPKDKRAGIIRQANNHPVQGLAADIMKIAEVNLNRYIKEKGWDKLVKTPEGEFPLVRVMVSAHDEALVSGHISIPAEEILLMKKKCMEISIENGVDDEGKRIRFAPLFTSTSIIDNWKEGKEDAYAIPYKLRDQLIQNYLDTGVSCISPEIIKDEYGDDKPNTKELMLEVINKYRDEELITYMEEIIREVGLDADAIADKVRHPSLTHELISRFRQTKEHKDKNGSLNHIDHIKYSVELYLQFRDNPEFVSTQTEDEKVSDKSSEELTKLYYEEITGLADVLTFVDADGNVEYLESYNEEEEEYSILDTEEVEFIARTTESKVIRVWELQDVITISTDGLSISDCDELLKLMYKYHDPNGYSIVKLFHNNKLLDTGIRVEQYDKKEVEDFLNSRAPLTLTRS